MSAQPTEGTAAVSGGVIAPCLLLIPQLSVKTRFIYVVGNVEKNWENLCNILYAVRLSGGGFL